MNKEKVIAALEAVERLDNDERLIYDFCLSEQFPVKKPATVEVVTKKRTYRRHTARRWTEDDDYRLETMKKQGIANRAIANRLGRTLAATETRMSDLRKKGRLPPTNRGLKTV